MFVRRGQGRLVLSVELQLGAPMTKIRLESGELLRFVATFVLASLVVGVEAGLEITFTYTPGWIRS